MITAVDTNTAIVAEFTPEELARAVEGELIQGGQAATVGSPCTDTRALCAGQTFWAIAGERFDGHDFVPRAVAAGAAGLVVEAARQNTAPAGTFLVAVDDTTLALGRLAAAVLARRRAMSPGFEVFAITGSNGKTTTKEMLAGVLGVNKNVLKTAGNFNNWIGLPLTVFRLTAAHDVAVLEMGANAPGEIRWLQQVARPDVCIVTSLSAAHLEGFASVEGVAQAKGEIFEADQARRFVVPRSERHWFASLASDERTRTVGERDADVVIDAVQPRPQGVYASYRWDDTQVSLEIPLLGAHNASNFGLVIAALADQDAPTDAFQRGLDQLELPPGRMEVCTYRGNIRILQDAYNANPASMRAALSVLTERAAAPSRVVVLGEMKELGADSAALHAALGREVALLAPRLLITVGGPNAAVLAQSAKDAGLANVKAFDGADVAAIVSALSVELEPADTVLLKGSRAVALERIVAGLTELESSP